MTIRIQLLDTSGIHVVLVRISENNLAITLITIPERLVDVATEDYMRLGGLSEVRCGFIKEQGTLGQLGRRM